MAFHLKFGLIRSMLGKMMVQVDHQDWSMILYPDICYVRWICKVRLSPKGYPGAGVDE